MSAVEWSRRSDWQQVVRWREFAAVTGIWLTASAVSGTLALATVAAALALGVVAALVLSHPLAADDQAIVNTATARRVAIATLAVGAVGAGLVAAAVEAPQWTVSAVAFAAVWVALAITSRVHPLAIGAGDRTAPDYPPLPASPAGATLVGKRVVDIVVSGILLVVSAPVLAASALAIRLHDGGPAMFRQQRLAYRAGEFEMLKFRSMVLNAEDQLAQLQTQNQRSGPLFKMSNDPRVTPVGQVIRELSIDELPQLINIFRGDMSLVGPRPALPREAKDFDPTLAQRTLAKPGLTGLWQAEARSDPDFARFRSLDLRYLYTASPALDLCIILATATEVLTALVARPFRRVGIDVAAVDGIAATGIAGTGIAATGTAVNGTDLRKKAPLVIDLRETVDAPAASV